MAPVLIATGHSVGHCGPDLAGRVLRLAGRLVCLVSGFFCLVGGFFRALSCLLGSVSPLTRYVGRFAHRVGASVGGSLLILVSPVHDLVSGFLGEVGALFSSVSRLFRPVDLLSNLIGPLTCAVGRLPHLVGEPARVEPGAQLAEFIGRNPCRFRVAQVLLFRTLVVRAFGRDSRWSGENGIGVSILLARQRRVPGHAVGLARL